MLALRIWVLVFELRAIYWRNNDPTVLPRVEPSIFRGLNDEKLEKGGKSAQNLVKEYFKALGLKNRDKGKALSADQVRLRLKFYVEKEGKLGEAEKSWKHDNAPYRLFLWF